jgi:ubiquitin-like modifier-activating enzyme ATG7
VELFVSILQHPKLGRAPAYLSDNNKDDFVHPLGVVPHTIRGFLSNFSNLQIVGSPYDHCSACSPPILKAYLDGDWKFVLQALTQKGFVEEVSGLTEVQRQAEQAALQFDDDEDEFEID